MPMLMAWPTSETAPLVAFDLDGTLLRVRAGVLLVNFTSPASVRDGTEPDQVACALVREARASNLGVAYVSARAEILRAVTAQQLETAQLPHGPLILQARYTGAEAAIRYKAKALRELQETTGCPVVLYVGDEKGDETAATLAGIPFLHATEFKRLAGVRADPRGGVHILLPEGPPARDDGEGAR